MIIIIIIIIINNHDHAPLQENSIVLNGSVMFNASRIPHSAGDVYFDEGMERYKLCMCGDGTLFRVQVKYPNMGCQTSENPCGKAL